MDIYSTRAKLINLLFTLMLWDLSTNGGDKSMMVVVESIVITNQSQLNQFLKSSTASSIKGNSQDINISLNGGNQKSYVLDIVSLMRMNISYRKLIMKGEGGLAIINCTTDQDPEKLEEIVRPISNASLVLIDGLEFTSCPVPIMIEEASKVMIQNCVFQNHKYGALSIYNSKIIKVKNCTFQNNTSDGYFTKKPFQGSAGGLSIGYNSSDSYFIKPYSPNQDNHLMASFAGGNFTTSPDRYPHLTTLPPSLLYPQISVELISSTFTGNSAVLPAGQGGSSTDVLMNNVFTGRGGALSVLINTGDYFKFKLSNNSFINNSAEAFGGGVYCLTQRGFNQTYIIHNNVFINNKGPRAGALALLYLIVPNNAAYNYNVCNCTFYNNTATLIAGAVMVSAVYELTRNVHITFKDCRFFKNAAVIHGGSFNMISFDFFNSIPAESPITFINCIFEDNVAADGAAINLLHYGAKFYNVTFKNNMESAVQMIGCIVEFHDKVKFVGNKVKNGARGALYIISFGQIKVFPGTVLTFENNEGQIGASIVVLTKRFSHAPAFNHLLYNPQCFLLHQDSKLPYSSVDNVELRFTDNTALEATAIFIHNAQQCSWIGYSPPHFNSTSILEWKFLNISDQLNVSQNASHIQASLSDIEVCNNESNMGDKYLGEYFSLSMRMIDEMNQTASGFMQLDVFNIDNQSTTEYKIRPAIVYHDSSKVLNITVVTKANTPSAMTDGTNVTVVVKEFMRANKSISSNFTLRVVPCIAGYELKYDSILDGFTCQRYHGNTHSGTCEGDHTILLLSDGQWGLDQRYIEQPENFKVYPCPPGYCRCFQNLCGSDNDICSFAYFNGASDKQCHCDREGYLCGDCKDSKGVSALLNRCVDCGNVNILILVALFIADTTLIIVMLCKDFDFPALLFPTVFFINMVSYTGESYPTSYDRVGKYIYFINSLLSLYFPYDFCLYSGATPLAMYAFRYFPLCLTIIICFIGFTLHQCICQRVKRFSWNNLWLLLTLQYGHVVYTSMTILHCPQVLNENGEHESRWFVKGSLQCFTNYHIPLALCAIIILVICLLLIPFLGLVATGKLTRPHLVGKLTKHLQHPFKENLPWWCMVELGRKLVFLQLLISFPQNTGPPMFTLMTLFALYAYVLPYKEMFVNITELFFQLSLLIFLILRSTKSIVDGYLKFPHHKHGNAMDTTRCSSDPGIASLTWILFPFAYLPLVVIIGIFSVKMLRRLWQCVCCTHNKKHHKHVLQGKSTTSCPMNPSSTNYYLVGIHDDSAAFLSVTSTTDDDSY